MPFCAYGAEKTWDGKNRFKLRVFKDFDRVTPFKSTLECETVIIIIAGRDEFDDSVSKFQNNR